MTEKYDFAIVGGGIVGLATARAVLISLPNSRVLIMDKETDLASHQTGHNSGVIHSGIYYRPDSLKARLCLEGALSLTAFCDRHGIRYHRCGKIVVATSPEEIPGLEELYRRGCANKVPGLALIGPEQLHELEPHSTGLRALHVPTAAIVDYKQVVQALAQEIRSSGGTIQNKARVNKTRRTSEGWLLSTTQGDQLAGFLINCGGLHSDRIAHMAHSRAGVKIVPFRGEYYELSSSKTSLVKGLIYPVPDPRFPFLGVHFSRRIDGRVEAGPNAVVALKREGYRKRDFDLIDAIDTLTFPGFWRMAARYWKTGLMEMYRSWNKKAFLRSLQRLVPEIQEKDLLPGGSGVRAQALDMNGTLVDDFQLVQAPQALHVCNAPSPAATASLAIGEFIARAVRTQNS